MSNYKPIGIFDSGVGGLSCAGPFSAMMPKESIIYFGDTLRAPYGVRETKQVQKFALQIADFLVSKDVKLIAIACNTITVAALDIIRKAHPDIPVLGTIEPASAKAAELGGNIGVIATPLTINSGAYEKEIKSISPDAKVFSLACPDLVTLIEQGHTDDNIIEASVRTYLDSFVNDNRINTLILGCTHFPLIDSLILRLYPGLLTVSSSGELAKAAFNYLKDTGSDTAAAPEYDFYASRADENFRKMAEFACPELDFNIIEHVL